MRPPELGHGSQARRADLIRRLARSVCGSRSSWWAAVGRPKSGALLPNWSPSPGWPELRGLLDARFAARADALKARAALVAAERAAELTADLSGRVVAGPHRGAARRCPRAGRTGRAERVCGSLLRICRPSCSSRRSGCWVAQAWPPSSGWACPPVHAAPASSERLLSPRWTSWRTIGEGVFFDTASTRLARVVVRSAGGRGRRGDSGGGISPGRRSRPAAPRTGWSGPWRRSWRGCR